MKGGRPLKGCWRMGDRVRQHNGQPAERVLAKGEGVDVGDQNVGSGIGVGRLIASRLLDQIRPFVLRKGEEPD
jgi:hypothetical protein